MSFSSTPSITFSWEGFPPIISCFTVLPKPTFSAHLTSTYGLLGAWTPCYLNWCQSEQSCRFVNYPWWEGVLVRILYLLILNLQERKLNRTSLVTSLGYVFRASVYSNLYTLVETTTYLWLRMPYPVTPFTSPAMWLIYQTRLMPESWKCIIFTPRCIEMRLAAELHPDLLGSLSAPRLPSYYGERVGRGEGEKNKKPS